MPIVARNSSQREIGKDFVAKNVVTRGGTIKEEKTEATIIVLNNAFIAEGYSSQLTENKSTAAENAI